jgi:hypothetical protein
MKDYIIIGLLIVIVLIIITRRVSTMSPAPPNCGSRMIHKNLKCSNVYPGLYEKDGPVTGDRKFCCA